MVKFNWSTFWIVLVSCFWTMILAFFVELYLVGAMMIVMAIAITGVWCISLLRRILASGAEPKHERRGGASQ